MLRPTILLSKRLRLRSAKPGDGEALFTNYFGDKDASLFLGRLPHQSLAQTEEFLSKSCMQAWQVPGQSFAWVVADRMNDEPVGIFLAFLNKHIAEIHYGIGSKYSGRGYATEACQIASDWLIAQNEIHRVCTAVDVEHLATQKVLEKAGFQREGILQNSAVLPAFGASPRNAISYSKI